MSTSESFKIRKGRAKENFLQTEFKVIDQILATRSDNIKTNPLTLLGFYDTLRRFINRKNFQKENEVNYDQNDIKNKMGISNTLYYTCLKALFNLTLIDIEKCCTVDYFVNYNCEDKPNIRLKDTFVLFSTLENNKTSKVESIVDLISEKRNIPASMIKILQVENNTTYIVHEWACEEADKGKHLIECRSWDECMKHFSKPKSIKVDISKEDLELIEKMDDDGVSAERKEGDNCNLGGVSAEKKVGVSLEKNKGVSAERKTYNNINKLLNNINKYINIINQSSSSFETVTEKDDEDKTASINDLKLIIKKSESKAFTEPICKFVNKTIEQMYYSNKMADVIGMPLESIKENLKDINYYVITKALERFNTAQTNTDIIVPVNYFAKCIWTSLQEAPYEINKMDHNEQLESITSIPDKIKKYIENTYDQTQIMQTVDNPSKPFGTRVITIHNYSIDIYWDVNEQRIKVEKISEEEKGT